MPEMVVTNRTSDVVVRTLSGTSYVFRPGKPVPVLMQDVETCIERGAGFTRAEEEAQAQLPGNMPKKQVVLTRQQLHEKMLDLFRDMIVNPAIHRDHFTAAGRPNVRWVSSLLDADINSDMVLSAWTEALAERVEA